ncbi:ataxin-10 [Cavenderia fasciculata]|uniref:Ataxin-10 n=1 Tax=Cavenderia fasciculata TaxID=261658 RepID=F4Q919_CACFS|nr:ataxin-10 [Cavenderia fasciculata]EGG15188.1 ataxin-10 [Cavenderia fasciculata]|eukprot:XP_004351908.1 ataxin-10 [Cavenderia fasciculata]
MSEKIKGLLNSLKKNDDKDLIIQELTKSLTDSKDYSTDNRNEIGKIIIPILNDRLINDDEYTKDEKQQKICLLTVRLLRNLCAFSPDNQYLVLTSQPDLLNWLYLHLKTSPIQSIAIAISQLLVNSIVSNQSTQSLIWNHWFKSNQLLEIITISKESTIGGILMLIYNCLLNNKSRIVELVDNQVGIELIKKIILLADQYNDDVSDSHNQIFHWIYLLIRLLIRENTLPTIFKSFGSENYKNTTIPLKDITQHPIFKGVLNDNYNSPSIQEMDDDEEDDGLLEKSLGDGSGRTNQDQVRLLNLLDSLLVKERNIYNYIQKDSIMDLECCLFLLKELIVLYNMDFKKKALPKFNNQSTVLNENDFDSIYFIIKILANITCYTDEMLALVDGKTTVPGVGDDLNTALAKNGLIALCVGTLHTTADTVPHDPRKPVDQDKKHEMGFKKEIIRILGNVAYLNEPNQHEIRELGGIQLILNNCRIDPNNPYIKEWGVFAIRNIMENNEKNQQLVQDLKMQGVANQNELESMVCAVEDIIVSEAITKEQAEDVMYEIPIEISNLLRSLCEPFLQVATFNKDKMFIELNKIISGHFNTFFKGRFVYIQLINTKNDIIETSNVSSMVYRKDKQIHSIIERLRQVEYAGMIPINCHYDDTFNCLAIGQPVEYQKKDF